MRVAALVLPALELQAALRERFSEQSPIVTSEAVALAIVEGPEDRKRVTACTALARNRGVSTGQALTSARACCPDLVVIDTDPERLHEALATVADAVGTFGPVVSLAPPNAVLVDTTGVLSVTIRARAFVAAAESLGFVARAAIARTPFAALALASRATEPVELALDPDTERRAVERLPLQAAHLPPTAHEALQVVGIRTVGAFMALQPESLARRFGGNVRQLWRQAHGRAAPKLEPWTPDRPVTERARHDDAPIERLEPLGFVLKSLLDRALLRLEGRGQGAEEIVVTLETLECTSDGVQRTPHTLGLNLGRACADGSLWLQLLRERLQRAPLPGAVERTQLCVTRAGTLGAQQLELFGDRAPAETIHTTVARLASIVGDARFTPELREDFRPERAWLSSRFAGRASNAEAAPPPGQRPTRLLRTPRALELRGAGPPPSTIAGPERLVSGWWDGDPMARDYWIVSDRWGRRSWIYRDLRTNRWFLHGHFD